MSTLTTFKGDAPWLIDNLVNVGGNPALGTTGLIDATGDKFAVVGCIWHPTVKSGTINVRKVHFKLGAVTFNALSVMRVSLQSISATAGPPYQPDGTVDQSYSFSGTGLTSNTWTATGNLSADRAVDLSAVSFGDANSRWVAAVFEYTTFTAADSIIFNTNSMTLASGASVDDVLLGGHALLNTASWAALTGQTPIIALECDDGTFAFIEGGLPVSTYSSAAVSSTGAIRAAGLKFRFPIEVAIDGLGLILAVQNAADGTLILYDSDGTTALASVTIDNDAVFATAGRMGLARFLSYTLTANTYYRLAFVASVATSTSVYYCDVNAAGLMDGLMGGQDMHWTERDSAGTWTDTTTRRPHFALKISSVHDGVGGASGVQYRANMSGNV